MEGPNKSTIEDESGMENFEKSKLFQKLKDGSTKEINLAVDLNGNGLSVSGGELDPNCISVWVTNLSGKKLSSLEQRAIIEAIKKGGHLDI